MDKADLAAILNGCAVGSEITTQQNSDAAADGLIVIFLSGDVTKFRGAFNMDVPTEWSRRIFFNKTGTNFCGQEGEAWDPNHEGGLTNCVNSIDVDISSPYAVTAPWQQPHEPFDVMDGSSVVGTGAVMWTGDLLDPPAARRAK